MRTAAALEIPAYEGLTDFETKLATALIQTRYRGSFSNIRPRTMDEGGTALEVWARAPSDTPAFRLLRQGDCVVAISDRKGLVASSESIEGIMAEIAAALPPPLPF